MGEFLVWVAVDVMPALRPESESRDEKLMEIVVCALHRFASLCCFFSSFFLFCIPCRDLFRASRMLQPSYLKSGGLRI
jgi:hypothetical protein